MNKKSKLIKPNYWKQACAELSKKDLVMAKIIQSFRNETLKSRKDPFYSINRAIIGQQISVKASDSIWGKYVEALKELKPQTVRKVRSSTLRSCGLSSQKIKYVKNIGKHFSGEMSRFSYWEKMNDRDVEETLIDLNGVGKWTIEMFLIFCLMRPHIFPVADIGLQRSIANHYNHGKRMSEKQIENLACSWKPWRTVATWYLWRALDPVPVCY